MLPPGATYLPGFIGADEEERLVRALDAGERSAELKRRVQHFGYRDDYRARMVTPDTYIGALPDWAASVCLRLRSGEHFHAAPTR